MRPFFFAAAGPGFAGVHVPEKDRSQRIIGDNSAMFVDRSARQCCSR